MGNVKSSLFSNCFYLDIFTWNNDVTILHFFFKMDHNVILSDYAAMDRVLKEERAYILNIVKQVKKSGCNVLLVQKSILRYVFIEFLNFELIFILINYLSF